MPKNDITETDPGTMSEVNRLLVEQKITNMILLEIARGLNIEISDNLTDIRRDSGMLSD